MLDQGFVEDLCNGTTEIFIDVDANTAENCAIVTLTVNGTQSPDTPANLNLVGGCMSGTLGEIPVTINDNALPIRNAVVTASVDASGFDNGVVGGTLDGASAMMLDPLATNVFDILESLANEPATACNAISTTFELAGAAVTP